MTHAERKNRAEGSGIAYILTATGIAGAIGYAIQALVPGFVSRQDYVAFSVYWSAVFLIAGAISGIQQEITRATRPRTGLSGSARDLVLFSLCAAALFGVLTCVTSLWWGPAALGSSFAALIAPLGVAAVAYSLVAALSGTFYGARNWRAAAGMTVVDSSSRLVAIIIALALGGSVVVLGWAVAIPFAVATALLWSVAGRRAIREVELDVGLSGLWRNSASTVGAALATGVMISGLPLVLGLTSRGMGEVDLSALILVITLTRAPLVIPLLALQGYLLVTLRDDPTRATRRTVLWGSLLLAVAAVFAGVGAFIGPWLVGILYGDRYSLPSGVYAIVIIGAGVTALLALTGASTLASGSHVRYVLGWACSSVALLVGLILAPTSIWSAAIVIAAAPFIGVAVHAAGLAKKREGRKLQA